MNQNLDTFSPIKMTVSNFVKYIYVSGEKMARNDCKMVKCKSCAFHFESESKLQNSHNCSKVLKPSLFLLQTASGNALEFVWWGKNARINFFTSYWQVFVYN